MGWTDYLIMLFAGLFSLLMVVALIGFVVRLFRESHPQRRRRG